MARLKRASSILNWEVLDDFYGYELKGLNLKPNSFERGFCRCGESSTSYLDKCSCGNFSFRKIINESENCYGNKVESFYDKEVFDTRYSYKVDSDKDGQYFQIIRREISFKEESAGELKMSIKESNVIKFYENKMILDEFTYNESRVDYSEVTRGPLNSLIKAINKKSETDYDEFNEQGEDILEYFTNNCQFLVDAYSDFIKYVPDECNISRYTWKISVKNTNLLYKTVMAAFTKFCFSELLSDPLIYRYPNILRYFIEDFTNFHLGDFNDNYFYRNSMEEWTSLENLFKQANGYYEIIEFVAKEEKTLATLFSTRWYNHLDIYCREDCNLKLFLERVEDDEVGLGDIVFHYVRNGMIPYYEGNRILSHTKRFNDDKIELFKIYLKENISNVKKDLVASFELQLETMDKYHIEKTAENFKVKTYNFLINQACLAETYRLPQDKVDMFLDMFEVNPLEAMTLISNRRKMTKKELDAFLEVMFKN